MTEMADKFESMHDVTEKETAISSYGSMFPVSGFQFPEQTDYQVADQRATEFQWAGVLGEMILDVRNDIKRLSQEVASMKKALAEINQSFPTDQQDEIIELRDLTEDQARVEILELFKETQKPLFYSDIAEKLCLDLRLVVEVCNNLIEKGNIEVDDSA